MAVITRTMMSGYFFDTSETNKMCSCTRELIHQPNIAETTESHLNQKEIHEIGRSRLNRSTQTNRPRKLISYKSQLSNLVNCDPVFLSFLDFLDFEVLHFFSSLYFFISMETKKEMTILQTKYMREFFWFLIIKVKSLHRKTHFELPHFLLTNLTSVSHIEQRHSEIVS